jgi:CubicO group peptidase (beta-lactamase class C family)
MMTEFRPLKRVRPEEAGIAPEAISRFLRLVQDKQVNLHSFMLLRHGKVAAEGSFAPFQAGELHPIYSVSKSVTSAAIGIAIGEGLLSLTDRVVDLLPEKVDGEPHPYIARMTVEHLLSMTTAHRRSTNTQMEDWVYGFLNSVPDRPPGASFAYDTTGTHTLCAILQKLTGMTVHDYLRTRLFDPIGIGEIEWESCPMNINKGGSGIKCTVEDMARFGQLYLQDGVWNGTRLLPEGWVELSTGRRVDNSGANVLLDGKPGYGYQFWRLRNNAYCAFGMGGQFVVVIPDKDVVLAVTANTQQSRDGQQTVTDCLWEGLYPGFQDSPVERDDYAYKKLQGRLSGLSVPLPEGKIQSEAASRIHAQAYRFTGNELGIESGCFSFGENAGSLLLEVNGEKRELGFGLGQWVKTAEPFYGKAAAAASAVWTDETTLVLHVHLLRDMQKIAFICRFLEDEVIIHVAPAGTFYTADMEHHLAGTAC